MVKVSVSPSCLFLRSNCKGRPKSIRQTSIGTTVHVIVSEYTPSINNEIVHSFLALTSPQYLLK
ncbi:hypothetical protein GIB67_016969 [Kingdonia uniflora]|uniref:Uncharacterized protein n=1 Tax=Kingdonia uniflora TaxID=39325 RepID=A0A7J7M3G8_9MAGN|nr:hypothetical protein GIB67_016969 [Kingdonia uniflora]